MDVPRNKPAILIYFGDPAFIETPISITWVCGDPTFSHQPSSPHVAILETLSLDFFPPGIWKCLEHVLQDCMNSKIKSESKVCKVFEKSFGPQKPSVSPFISSISAIGRVPKMENAIIRVWFSTFHSSPSVAIGTCFRSQVAPWVSMMLLLPLFCSGFKPATNMFNASVINRSRQQKMLIPCEWLLDFHGLLSFIFICNGMVIDQRVYHGITIIYWWYTYPSEKWWSLSVGMMKFPIYGKKNMFQTTNQIYHGVPFHDHLWSRISSLVTHHSQGIGRGAVGAQFLNGSGGKANLVALPRWGAIRFLGVKSGMNVGES